MTTLTFEVNDRQVTRLLANLDTALSPAGIAGFLGATVDPYLRERAQRRFDNEGDDVVGKWVQLAGATQQIRASQGYGPSHPINKRTGDLEAYIVDAPHRLTVDAIGATLVLPGAPASGVLRTKVITAQRGQTATQGGKRETPARPVLGMNERDLAFVIAAMSFYVTKAARVL